MTSALPGLKMTRNGFRTLVRTQAKLLFREPGAVLAGIALPILLMTVFSFVPAFRTTAHNLGDRSELDVALPTFALLSPILLALTGLPVSVANLRERGVLRRLSVSPVPAAGVLAAQVAVIAAMAVGTALAVVVIGLAAGARTPDHLPLSIAAFVLGATAVLAVGMVIAGVARTSAIATGYGMPLMILNFFFGGVYVPLQILPSALRTVSGFVPFGAVVDTWSGSGSAWQHLAVLAGYTVVGSLLAAKLFKWE